MALDNWFHNWHPPYFQPPFHEPVTNYSTDDHQSVKKSQSPTKFLPFLLSLNLLKPPGGRYRPETFSRSIAPKRVEYINPNEHETLFTEDGGSKFNSSPLDHPGFFSNKRNYGSKTKDVSNLRTFPEKSRRPHDIEKKYLDENQHSRFGAPIGHPKLVKSTEGSYAHLYTDSMGFPDPFKENLKSSKNGNRTYEEEHHLKPVELTGPFKTWYRWKSLDFNYPSDGERSKAIASGEFVPENNLPLGIEVYKNRIFLTMPKWKPGVPVTLAQLPRVPKEESPKLVPYPSWAWHSEKSCDLITSVFRMHADECGRLWVLDSGKISITTQEAHQHCPPKLMIFDLETDKLLEKFIFPDEFIKEDGLYSNIIVDIREGACHDAHAYMVDVWRFGVVVFRLIDHNAWRVTHRLFFPDPLASSYQLHHLKFEWTDGIFGLALGPVDQFHDDRILYFHPMSSFREFYVKASYLRTEDSEERDMDQIKVLGQSRGPSGHVSSSVMDRNGIMYYNLVTRDSIGCWDSRKPYKRENLGVIAKSKQTLVFPNDMRLDKEKRQSMWILTNRLPYYLIEGLDVSRMNFRVISAYTDEATKGTICDPDVHNQYTDVKYKDGSDCY